MTADGTVCGKDFCGAHVFRDSLSCALMIAEALSPFPVHAPAEGQNLVRACTIVNRLFLFPADENGIRVPVALPFSLHSPTQKHVGG